MIKSLGSAFAVFAAVGLVHGCASTPPPAAPTAATGSNQQTPAVSTSATRSEVVARINGASVTMDQLMPPLLEARGLPILLNLVQLELAKQKAKSAGVSVIAEDIRLERERMLDRMFEDSEQDLIAKIDEAERKNQQDVVEKLRKQIREDREKLLVQVLGRNATSRGEFELGIETNAYLRKIAEPQIKGKITDELLRTAFQTEYGGKVRVRHIQSSNPQALLQAKQRIEKGEKFEDVAREVSQNPRTKALGGELPPFTLSEPLLPANFKQAAFDLKDGEISGLISAEPNYHIIKLEERLAPKAVKFENVREFLRKRMYENAVEFARKQLRSQIEQEMLKNLSITDPVLKAQFEQRVEQNKQTLAEEEKAREQDRQRREAENLKRQPPMPDLQPAGPTGPAPDPSLPQGIPR